MDKRQHTVHPAFKAIDIGVNLADKSFDADRRAVIQSANAVGVTQMILTGTCLDTSKAVINICQDYPNVLFCTAGCHPHHAKDFKAQDLEAIAALLNQHHCIKAIGECGLDFNRNFSPPDVQEKVFIAQLDLASESTLPCFFHERDASERFYSIIKNYRDYLAGGVVHCFTGDRQALRACLDMGFYVGITGWVCDERRGKELQALIPYIPPDRLLAETDAPYLLPRDLRPKPASRRNEPRYLPHIIETIAHYANKPVLAMAQQIFDNSKRFFNI